MPYVLITLGTLLFFALLLLKLTGGTLRKLFGFFVEELDENRSPLHPVSLSLRSAETPPSNAPVPPQSVPPQPVPKKTPSEPGQEQDCTVAAVLTHKIDARKRIVDNTGHATFHNESFELVFQTKEGTSLHLSTPHDAFQETPFHQNGWLTYRGNRFIRFRYSRPRQSSGKNSVKQAQT